jgi:HTH-type transcriptional regulator, global nitrogen regulator NrpRI
MQDKIERKRLAILRILKEANETVGSQRITELLTALHYDISERTVRFHLNAMDKDGLTECIGRQGRRITVKGLMELSKARVFEKVGFLAAKIDEMSYSMNFDLKKRQGSVVVNVSLVKRSELRGAILYMTRVFEAGYSMGQLITLINPGDQIGDMVVPEDMVGVGTVCSITLNGVLLKHGIPVYSRFGGLLEIQEREPQRFTALINYDGTTLDPLEIFIKSGMTDYKGATYNGNGLIGASFREIPASSREKVMELAAELDKVGLGGFMKVGWPGESLLEIPITEGRAGAIVIGGLNPIAILEEYGMEVYSRALSGLVAYTNLFHYKELLEKATNIG